MLLFRKKTRNFKYSIPDLSISQAKISIQSKDCKTANDLKKKIAEIHHIPENDLLFDKRPNKKLKKIDDNYNFKLIFHSSYPDIEILIPGNKKILIKDCYKLKYGEIFPYLEKQGYYYTKKLIKNNFMLFLNDNEINTDGFPFASSNKTSSYELKLIGNTVTLYYDHYLFTASENEKASKVITLVQKPFQNLDILILDSSGKSTEIIKLHQKYKIKVEKIVKFTNKFDSSEFYINVDYFESVSDVQKSLAKKLKVNQPENVFILDFDKNKIPISDKSFRSYSKLNTNFYFEIQNKKTVKSTKQMKKPVVRSSINKPKKSKYLDEKPKISAKTKNIKETKPTFDSKDTEHYDEYYDESETEDDKDRMITYFYSIDELNILCNTIRINTKECQNVFDLKKIIAFKNHISDKLLQFKHLEQTELKKIDAYTTFELIVQNSFFDANILIPNGKKVIINDCYNMKFNEIFNYIENEKFYFSPECISKNVKLYFNSKEISTDGYPFLLTRKTTYFELKLSENTVIMKYGKYTFAFSSNENVTDAKNLIKKAFPDLFIIIRDSDDNSVYTLKSKVKYYIRAEKFVFFYNIENNESFLVEVDINDTILDAKKNMINEHEYFKHVNLDDLIIYNNNKNIIKDVNKPIKKIQNLDKCFYFKAKVEEFLKIIIVFLNNKFYPIRKNVPVSTTINEIVDIVHNKCKIHDEIIIKCKSDDRMEILSQTRTIDHVKDKIVETTINGKKNYMLYVEFKSKDDETKAVSDELHKKTELKKETSLKTIDYSDSESYYYFSVGINDDEDDDKDFTDMDDDDDKDFTDMDDDDDKDFTDMDDDNDKDFTDMDDDEIDEKVKQEIEKRVKSDVKTLSIVKSYSSFSYEKPKKLLTEKKDIEEKPVKKEVNIKKSKSSFLETIPILESTINPKKKLNKSIAKFKPKIIKIPPVEPKFASSSASDENDSDVDIHYSSLSSPTSPSVDHKSALSALNDSSVVEGPSNFYNFEFRGETKQIELQNNSLIESNEDTIKEKFNIHPNEQLIFKFMNNISKKESTKVINNKMNSFKNGTIRINIYTKSRTMLFIDDDQFHELEIGKERKVDDYVKFYDVCSKKDSEKKCIMKAMNIDNGNKKFSIFRDFVKEHEFLRALDHPNIIKTYGIFMGKKRNEKTNEKETPPFILLEHFNSNLEKLLKKKDLTKATLFKLIYYVAEGMRYIHFKDIVHCNLNPKNIFITDDAKIKIGEFGNSELISPGEKLTFSKKDFSSEIQYMAPELKKNEEEYDKKVDVYSFGVLIAFLLNEGNLPKFDKNDEFRIKIPSDFTNYAKDLIERCLSINPDDRPSFDDICNELKENYKELLVITKGDEEKITKIINHYKTKISTEFDDENQDDL